MLVYVTRPPSYEVIMGGWRSVPVWTDEPHFHHWPVGGWRPMKSEDPKATFYDRGWAYKGDRQSNCRFKPLVEQNAALEETAWRLMLWSCIPKHENVSLEDTLAWIDTPLPGEDPANEFCARNYDKLMSRNGMNSESLAQVHHKRFLMEVNLISAECKIIVPTVHFYEGPKTVKTQDIEEPYASRRNYACPEKEDDDIPF